MNIAKKIFNFHRNVRSKLQLLSFRLIYKDKFITGSDCYVRKEFSVVIEDEGRVVLGDRCFFNNNCSVNSLCGITIGNDCIFGENVHIYDHNHRYKNMDIPINDQGFSYGEVVIGDNCWIGSNVVILKGVTIHNHSVIGAGSVVYKDVPENSIMINNKIKKLNDEESR